MLDERSQRGRLQVVRQKWSWIVPDGLWEIAEPLLPPTRVRPQGGGTRNIPATVLWPGRDPLFPSAWTDQLDQYFADLQLQTCAGSDTSCRWRPRTNSLTP
ncbi:hypothetical protein F7R91_40580 [Streptomyces luteolifulvus]|uniref:Uncharacterized protein n=1 Tax=Streptomyces luteolifulvus TaxID=2615112 RepID=A0A6H9UNQ0_9ACTN|nr:hypothetical protein F7R91_40580 [Streptomyces luteolifulvus]